MKNDKLKKLERELFDLEQWQKLGLVPQKDIKKHQKEMDLIRHRIAEEKERLQAIREGCDGEEYAVSRRLQQGKQAYQETQTMVGVEADDEVNESDTQLHMDMTSYETESVTIVTESGEGGGNTYIEENDEDPFSDKNRWRRGILEDPDSDSW